jgi:hypothetical protein
MPGKFGCRVETLGSLELSPTKFMVKTNNQHRRSLSQLFASKSFRSACVMSFGKIQRQSRFQGLDANTGEFVWDHRFFVPIPAIWREGERSPLTLDFHATFVLGFGNLPKIVQFLYDPVAENNKEYATSVPKLPAGPALQMPSLSACLNGGFLNEGRAGQRASPAGL